jgi:NodT family efflux transporter outer membrane factor (OMF) lipoprotein
MHEAAGMGAKTPGLRSRIRLAVACGVMALAGCAGIPKHPPAPHSALPDATRLGLDERPSPAVADQWWTMFGDPQLDRLVETAMKNGPSLAEVVVRVRAAQAELAEAKAKGLPTAMLDAEVQRQRLSGHYVVPPPFAGTSQTFGDITANFSADLDIWGKRKALVARARRMADAASLDATSSKLGIIVSVVQAYIDLERAYRSEALAQRTADQRDGLLGLIANRVDSGLESTVERDLAQARLVNAQMDLAAARAEREIALHMLALLTGEGPAFTAQLTPPKLNPAAQFGLPDYLPADLVARRPDVQAARIRIEAATFGRTAARADFFPNINLTAFAGFASFGLSDLINSSSRTYGAGPAIHLPLFDGGALRAQYAHANTDVDAAVAHYDVTLLTAIRQVADRISTLRALDTELAMQRRAVAASQSAYDGTMTRYRSGLSSLLAVREADTLLIDAERRQLMLETGRQAQTVGLILALGGGYVATSATDKTAPSARTE